MTGSGFPANALRISAGAIVWAAHFAVIYGYTGLACARRFEQSGPVWVAFVPWVVGLATVVAAAATLYWVVPIARAGVRLDFAAWLSAWVAMLALGAILLEGAAVLWVPACG